MTPALVEIPTRAPVLGGVWARLEPIAAVLTFIPSISAWALLICLDFGSDLVDLCLSPSTPIGDRIAFGLRAADLRWSWVFGLSAVMTIAMMAPLAIGGAERLSRRSYRSERVVSVAGFVGGYLGVWMLVMTVAAPPLAISAVVLSVAPSGPLMTMAGCVLAAAWQMAPARGRALARAHLRQVTTPTGRGAIVQTAAWGARQGCRCILPCGPAMILTTIGGHNLLSAFVVALMFWTERRTFRPRQTGAVTLLLALGVVQLVS